MFTVVTARHSRTMPSLGPPRGWFPLARRLCGARCSSPTMCATHSEHPTLTFHNIRALNIYLPLAAETSCDNNATGGSSLSMQTSAHVSGVDDKLPLPWSPQVDLHFLPQSDGCN
eukprot:688386-Pyramimonas_sp.AAC.1